MTGLQVAFPGEAGPVRVINALDLAVAEGETLALVGESGSGGRVARIATNVFSNLSHIENAFGPQIGADCIDTSDFTA